MTRILEALLELSMTLATLPCPSSNLSFGRDPDFINCGVLVVSFLINALCRQARTTVADRGTNYGAESYSSLLNLAVELGNDRLRRRCFRCMPGD